MSESASHHEDSGEVAVQLLDTSSGRAVKSWTFQGQPTITIGRSPDQLVEVSDPYVSRSHASLVYRNGRWVLVSLGRNGVVVGNELITEYPVSGDVSFRLGMEGPTLRFRTVCEQSEIMATISFDTLPAPLLQLDDARVQNDVDQIAEGDYFQRLQHAARQLRRKREHR